MDTSRGDRPIPQLDIVAEALRCNGFPQTAGTASTSLLDRLIPFRTILASATDRFQHYKEDYAHLDLWTDPGRATELESALGAMLTSAATDAERYAYFMEALVRAGFARKPCSHEKRGPIRAVSQKLNAARPHNPNLAIPKIPNAPHIFLFPPTSLWGTSTLKKFQSVPPALQTANVARVQNDSSSLNEAPPAVDAMATPNNTHEIKLSCVYYLDTNIFTDGLPVHSYVPVFSSSRFCPYLSVEFEHAHEGVSDAPAAAALQKLAISSTIMVYNRWALRSCAARVTVSASSKKSSWLDNIALTPKKSSRNAKEKKTEEREVALCHWSVLISHDGWGLYVTTPKEETGLSTTSALTTNVWKGCVMDKVACGSFANMQALITSINDIHYWALTDWAAACIKDIRSLGYRHSSSSR